MAMASDVSMEPKPPDAQDSSPNPKTSFRDKLIGGDAGSLVAKEPVQSKGKYQITTKPSLEKDGMIFKSSDIASSSKSNNRNKRHRVDSSFINSQEDSSQKAPNPKNRVTDTKVSSKKGFTPFVPSHGIKTIMNVDLIAANRLRFKDEDKPPDNSEPKSL
ncbi:hypothetical protein SESBI_42551 [Sesbania bispinosa]|nr:hypothetical protein SESBI_42551 [Sesbania bispinosa]